MQFKCCGSHNYTDWTENVWLEQNQLLVPDSCCKTPTEQCGSRDHPSNIYKVEVGRPQHGRWEVSEVMELEVIFDSVLSLQLAGRLHHEIRGIPA